MIRRRTRAALAGLIPVLAIVTACGSGADAGSAPAPSAVTPPSAATAPERSQAQEAGRTMAEPGPGFARALTDRGIPAEKLGDAATLAQLARGICSQDAAGMPAAEIREHLAPVLRYAQSLVGDAMNVDQLSASFIDSARQTSC
ncbi:hypothetical protein [Tomitella fengzijianii]|uniref:Uncharacterized protein n=1 Tax=Tomitella fengzijianii TaxID=2597660 RepID=A0A516X3Z0_9ACTN|nr:hypothetical protein [Tomitella fengzijianii]QDQ97799.1 hypothetical protein FO059_11325 [Tomitella fengzijianii]